MNRQTAGLSASVRENGYGIAKNIASLYFALKDPASQVLRSTPEYKWDNNDSPMRAIDKDGILRAQWTNLQERAAEVQPKLNESLQ